MKHAAAHREDGHLCGLRALERGLWQEQAAARYWLSFHKAPPRTECAAWASLEVHFSPAPLFLNSNTHLHTNTRCYPHKRAHTRARALTQRQTLLQKLRLPLPSATFHSSSRTRRPEDLLDVTEIIFCLSFLYMFFFVLKLPEVLPNYFSRSPLLSSVTSEVTTYFFPKGRGDLLRTWAIYDLMSE